MVRRILVITLLLLQCTIVLSQNITPLFNAISYILEQYSHRQLFIPRIFNAQIAQLLHKTTHNDLITLMSAAEHLENTYIINALAAIIVNRWYENPDPKWLDELKQTLAPSTYAFIEKYIMLKNRIPAKRACGDVELSVADYVSLYDVPIEYFGSIGVLRFDNKNLTSLYGLQDISIIDVGIVTLSNNCIVGADLDPQFPSDPFQGIPNTYYLLIDHNLIGSLPGTFFQSTPFMSEIYFDHNLLTILPSGLFSATDELALLDLSYNMLTTVTTSDIQNLSNLNLIYLDHNSLTDIPSDLFQSSRELIYIFLENNSLTDWPATALNSLGDLMYLDLSNNDLMNFEPEYIHDGAEVILTGNDLTVSQQDFIQSMFPYVDFVF